MASASAAVAQRNQDATVYVGGLDDKVDEEMLWELFVQVSSLSVCNYSAISRVLLVDAYVLCRLAL